MSAVILVKPQVSTEICQQMMAIPGVEIHADGGDGRLVITLESDQFRSLADHMEQIRDLKGVLDATPVYQYSDPPESEAFQKEMAS
ncbi:periplasmic nitrate reductase chaperone NapD [Magnetococcus marinus MC-1]|uniref:Periplasmic nitrate reductase chaperone NapD n=2 Tax=Magnetococcus TaxID=162171 RepID=A0L808_MAGMM|nr:periplasmic nitrate reductase chaperone NapD [Magnetococcus marinus MC-1]